VDANAGNAAGVTRRHFMALGRYAAGSFAFLSAALLGGVCLLRFVYPDLPVMPMRTLAFAYYMLPLIGIGVALNTIKLRGYIPVFCGVFLLLAIVSEFI
jgi:mannose/fructose/N-acetylgalactosamine-specific phosphotransferase system component IIC